MLISSCGLYVADDRVDHYPLSIHISPEHARRPIVSVMRSIDTNIVRSKKYDPDNDSDCYLILPHHLRYHILVTLVLLILLCSWKIPYNSASAVGGQPGM